LFNLQKKTSATAPVVKPQEKHRRGPPVAGKKRTGLENKMNTGDMGPYPKLRDSIRSPVGGAQRGDPLASPPRGKAFPDTPGPL
jgi:hypothetical protein